MGAGESSAIQVKFNRPSLFYFAGEQVAGEISFENKEEKLTLDAIFLECVGEIGYTTQETRQCTDANGSTRTENYTKTHVIPFMNMRIPVVQPQYGQREIILFRGRHAWPFTFVLPPNLPPSLLPATVAYPYVRYHTRVVLDKPWYKPNTKQVYPLTIFPHVNLSYIPGGQQSIAFQNQNRKKTHLQGYLLRGGVVPGDKLSVHIDLQNPKQMTIKRIEATLIQHRQVAFSSHKEIIFRLDLPDLNEFSGTHLQRTFDLIIPTIYLSPTFTYAQSARISIYYELILDVKARGLFTDFQITVPVIVGTEPMSIEQQQQQQQQQQMNRPFEMPIASAPVMEYDEPPPSYETVMTNEKM